MVDRETKFAFGDFIIFQDIPIGVRAGGARGAAVPPQILGNSDFFGQREKIWAKPVFNTFPCFLNHYFEEINIFYFNLKLA